MMMEICVIVLILYVLFVAISITGDKDENMLSVYECGFDSVMSAWISFSFCFFFIFFISVLFLVFDVEITLLIPVPYVMMGWMQGLGVFVFMTVLLLGLLYEYYNGVLTWVEVKNV